MRLSVWLVSVVAPFLVAGPILVSQAVADDADTCTRGSGEERIAACTRLINSDRFHGHNQAVSYNDRGTAYLAKGDYDRAFADFNEAIWLDHKYPLAFIGRGNAYYAKRDYDRAIADYTEAIRLDPKYAKAYNDRGIAKRAKGDARGGDADIAKAKQLDPNIGN
jgi:tetratricopeptide (TPR) repeat protein